MGTIATTTIRERDITIKSIEGSVSFQELKQWVSEFYSERVTRNTIWDFSGATIVDLRSQDIRRIFNFTRQYLPAGQRGKAALVVSSEFQFGLSTLYKTHHDLSDHNVEHRVFRRFQDALEWIEED